MSPTFVFAQGAPADYERALDISKWTRNKVYRAAVAPHWSADGDRFWYRIDVAEGEWEFVMVDAIKGSRALAFDHAKLAVELGKLLQREISAKKLPIDQLTLDAFGPLRFNAFGRHYEAKVPAYSLRELGKEVLPASLPALRDVHPTRRTGVETTIRFVNQLKEGVKLFWIDPDGEHQNYGNLPAGSEVSKHTYAGHVWLVTDRNNKPLAAFEATEGGGRAILNGDLKLTPMESAEKPPSSGASSNEGATVLFQNDNVILREKASGKEYQLTTDGNRDNRYSGSIYWSPDRSHFVVLQTASVDERKIHLIESSPRDSLHGKLHTLTYVKPGDPLPIAKPHLFDVANHREIAVSTELFQNPWSIDHLHWDRDGKEFLFLFNQRGHQVLRLIGIDAKTGTTRAIVDENSKTFVDYSGKFFLKEIEEAAELIWMSERDGWNHLYLIDRKTGKVKNQITHGDWVVRGVDRVDIEKRQIWFRAGGIDPKQDPYHVHHCHVSFDGTGMVRMTHGDGSHRIQYSPDNRFILDTYSRVDFPPVTELRRVKDGALVCEIERSDISALKKAGWRTPERFVAKGRDDKTDVFGVIFRPSNFDPARSYPVVEQIYAGPHDSFVPKEFRAFHHPQELAELGFIVVQIDGMGTSNRSKSFHDVCWKNLGDSGFPDRILWMKAAAAKDPSLDIGRVGIYGGSAGGQSALRALLAHGDFYQAAAADCGCHDNRVDKIWWNEQWMGYPIGPHYRDQSNVTNAHKLKGKLLLTVGELDKNVDPISTMQVVNALIKAGKDFELLIVPGGGHGVGETSYAARRRKDFFVRHLLGVTPPDWNSSDAPGKQ